MELEKKRILAVDDTSANLHLLGQILKERGYDARLAPNGPLALASVSAEPPDLILLDIKMPGMDGFQVCERLKNDPHTKSIPVIFISALQQVSDKVKCFAAGGVDYISKPFNEEEVLARVETHLRIGSLQRRIEKKNKKLAIANEKLNMEITERRHAETIIKQSEERFRKLMDCGADPVIVHDLTGKIIHTNKMARQNLGYSSRELITMHISQIHEYALADERPYWENNPTNDIFPIETQYIKKDGTRFAVELRFVQVHLKDENVIVTFARDIGVRKRLEEERLRINKLASLAILSGGIAHDFNNLLFIITGNLSLIRNVIAPKSEIYNCFQEVENAVMRAKDLMRRLVTFSEGGSSLIQTAPVAKVIENALEFVGAAPGVTYDIRVPKNLWPVQMDAAQIQQVLISVLINANEAMCNGGLIRIYAKNLTIKTTSLEHGILLLKGKYVEILVKDQGVGISQTDLPHIFDPYYSTKEKNFEKGIGLGLAVSYSIIKNHGGAIAVETQKNLGSTFTIFLPIKQAGKVKAHHFHP